VGAGAGDLVEPVLRHLVPIIAAHRRVDALPGLLTLVAGVIGVVQPVVAVRVRGAQRHQNAAARPIARRLRGVGVAVVAGNTFICGPLLTPMEAVVVAAAGIRRAEQVPALPAVVLCVAPLVAVALVVGLATALHHLVLAGGRFRIAPVPGAAVVVVAVLVLDRLANVLEHANRRRNAPLRGARIVVLAHHLHQLAPVGEAVADVLRAGVAVLAVAVLQAGVVRHHEHTAARCRVAGVIGVVQPVVALLEGVLALASLVVAEVRAAGVAVVAGDGGVDTPILLRPGHILALILALALDRRVEARARLLVAHVLRADEPIVAVHRREHAARLLVARVHRAGAAVVAGVVHDAARAVVADVHGAGAVVIAHAALAAAAVVAARLTVALGLALGLVRLRHHLVHHLRLNLRRDFRRGLGDLGLDFRLCFRAVDGRVVAHAQDALVQGTGVVVVAVPVRHAFRRLRHGLLLGRGFRLHLRRDFRRGLGDLGVGLGQELAVALLAELVVLAHAALAAAAVVAAGLARALGHAARGVGVRPDLLLVAAGHDHRQHQHQRQLAHNTLLRAFAHQ